MSPVLNRLDNVRDVTLTGISTSTIWREYLSQNVLAEVCRNSEQVRVTLFEQQRRADGVGADVRAAYRAAWRALRLSRHDPADLLRQLAQHKHLASVMGESLQKYAAGFSQVVQEQRSASKQRQHRRARHAAAIRAHRAEMTRRLRDCRRSLLDALAQRNAVASRITKLQALVTEARAKSPELEHELRGLTTDDMETIMARLLELAARAAEYHRRATAAEARAAELHAGQERLVAAARAAGFVYTVAGTGAQFVTTTTTEQAQ